MARRGGRPHPIRQMFGPMKDRVLGPLDLAKIRHPRERTVFLLSALANVAVIAGAALLAYFLPEWLASHSRVTALVNRIRLAAVTAIVLLPLLGVLRLAKWAAFRENSVRLDREQVPQLFSILESQCRTLGVDPPELFASTLASVGLSTALRLGHDRRIVVLGPNLFAGLDSFDDRADVLEFVLAYELGRIELGHADWWMDFVFGYLKRIPVVRAPLLNVEIASRDRFAATLAPRSIRGLLFMAAGGDLLAHVDPMLFVRQVVSDDTPPRWIWVARMMREDPHVAERLRALHHAGFLDPRWSSALGLPEARPVH
jgi:hypothetical protein